MWGSTNLCRERRRSQTGVTHGIWLPYKGRKEVKMISYGTFEVRHEGLRTAIEGVDDHLAVRRACDLHTPVLKAWRGGRTDPGGLAADMRCLRREVEGHAGVVALLCDLTGVEKVLARRIEGTMERCEEGERILCEDFLRDLWLVLCEDVETLDHVCDGMRERERESGGESGTSRDLLYKQAATALRHLPSARLDC